MASNIYHGSECNGMVNTYVFIDGNVVTIRYKDGDLLSSAVRFSYEKKGKKYYILKSDSLSPRLDRMLSKKPDNSSCIPINAKTKREAQMAMIEKIVEPHINPGKYAFPFDVKKVRKGLRRALSSV